MNIALVASVNRDANTGLGGVTSSIGDAMSALGAHVDYFFLDDFPKAVGGYADKILFPWRLSLLPKFRKYDVVDTSTEHTILDYMEQRPLLVARSHGLEHVRHLKLLKDTREQNKKLSWKYPLYHGSYSLWEERMSLQRADLALLLNSFDRNFAIENLGVAPEKAHIVANGLRESFLGRPFIKRPDAEEDAVRIAFVGTYIERKGVHYLREPLTSVLRRFPSAYAGFFGTGCSADSVLADYPADVHRQMTVLPKFSNDELPELLTGYSIHLFPSLSEGFGIALLETMACGLVPIATDIPGPTEFCRHNENALIVRPADSASLEAGLETLIVDATLREDLRRNAYETAQKYSWSSIASKTLTLYEAAISRRAKSKGR